MPWGNFCFYELFSIFFMTWLIDCYNFENKLKTKVISGCIISLKVEWGKASQVISNASEAWANARKITKLILKSAKVVLENDDLK